MDCQPLVSIGVLTYCSSKYVIETLESAKAQTYQNIELIISDDCSSDDTVDVCRQWISRNASRFARTEIITTPVNTGTSANCNRLAKACKGKYFKIIAGDDILLPNCIEDNMNYAVEHPKCMLIVSQQQRITSEGMIYPSKQVLDFENFLQLSSPQRLHYYARTCVYFNVVTWFQSSELPKLIGWYDERASLLEDMPYLKKIFERDIKIGYHDNCTVSYRVGGISTSVEWNEKIINFKKLLIDSWFVYFRPCVSLYNPIDIWVVLCKRIEKICVYSGITICMKLFYSNYNYLKRFTKSIASCFSFL